MVASRWATIEYPVGVDIAKRMRIFESREFESPDLSEVTGSFVGIFSGNFPKRWHQDFVSLKVKFSREIELNLRLFQLIANQNTGIIIRIVVVEIYVVFSSTFHSFLAVSRKFFVCYSRLPVPRDL